MEERFKFVVEMKKEEAQMAELCRRFGISRTTGYLWWKRYQEQGAEGLLDRRCTPHGHPNQISEAIAEAILALRRAHVHWGPRKLLRVLQQRQPGPSWPAASTIGMLLKREGLVIARRPRRRPTPLYPQPLAESEQPNQVWCADFKGWFHTGDGQRCDPLTLSDHATRYLLRCQAVGRANHDHVAGLFDAAFHEYGLPEAIRTDNGPPFATRSLGGLSRLSVAWWKLGIRAERIQPGHPEQNGRHERMHRTLKAETAAPPAENRRAQQQRFDRFQAEYNQERPHEGLGQQTPASLYQPSPRRYPSRVAEAEYPGDWIVRKVRPSGAIKWNGMEIFVSAPLIGEPLGLAPIEDQIYRLHFLTLPLAVFDARTLRMVPLDDFRPPAGPEDPSL